MAFERLTTAFYGQAADLRQAARQERSQRRATIQRLVEQGIQKREAEKAAESANKAARTSALIQGGVTLAGALTGGALTPIAPLLGAGAGAAIGGAIGQGASAFVPGAQPQPINAGGLQQGFASLDAAQQFVDVDEIYSQFLGNESAATGAGLSAVPPSGYGAQIAAGAPLPTAFSRSPGLSYNPSRPTSYSTQQRSLNDVVQRN